MRFSLRTLMIICLLVTVAVGWLGTRYVKWKREQQLLADLDRAAYWEFPNAIASDDEIYERYSLDRLFKIAEHYSKVASKGPSDSTAARIAAGALAHLGFRYDMKSKKFMRDPRAIDIAERVFDSKIEPLATASTMILMGHHRLSDDVHASQYLAAFFEDGYDSDNPIDVYILVTQIYSEFRYSSGVYDIQENWRSPMYSWVYSNEQPSHSYEDKIDALGQVSPDAADAYAAMVEEIRKCDGKRSAALQVTLDRHADDMMKALDVKKIFRFMLKNLDLFKSQPDLRVPRIIPPQTPDVD